VLATDPYDQDPAFDSTVAHPARVYDYWLGGKDNFAADRDAGDEVLRAKPGIRQNVRANRAFLGRSVRFLAAEAGIRQFLDIGTGIPSAGNTHEVALAVDPLPAPTTRTSPSRRPAAAAKTSRASLPAWT
jgi:hypothetical protein